MPECSSYMGPSHKICKRPLEDDEYPRGPIDHCCCTSQVYSYFVIAVGERERSTEGRWPDWSKRKSSLN